MAGKKRDSAVNERLDRLGLEVVRAAAANEAEADALEAQPFLYARLRSRIAAERERREEGERWLPLWGIVWRAVPAMAMVAVFAFVLFWSTNVGTRSGGYVSVESLLGTRDAGIEQVVFADNQPLSSDDDVLATIMNEDEQGVSR
jgi:anti-sigma-K factor RskA